MPRKSAEILQGWGVMHKARSCHFSARCSTPTVKRRAHGHHRSIHCCSRLHIDDTASDALALLSGAPLCLATVSNSTPSGTRGLVADTCIPAGCNVLEIAEANVLKVPKHVGAVATWREWLRVYVNAHGELPTALVSFLAGALCERLNRRRTLFTYLLYVAHLGIVGKQDLIVMMNSRYAEHLLSKVVCQVCSD